MSRGTLSSTIATILFLLISCPLLANNQTDKRPPSIQQRAIYHALDSLKRSTVITEQAKRSQLDSLWTISYNAKDQMGMGWNLLARAIMHRHAYRFDSLVYYAEAATTYFNPLYDQDLLAESYLETGTGYLGLDSLDEALVALEKAKQHAERAANSPVQTKTLSRIAAVYYKRAEYVQAAHFWLAAVDMASSIRDLTQLANNYINLGALYTRLDDQDLALEYYVRALRLLERYGRTQQIAAVTGNIGVILNRQEDYVQAEAYQRKSIAAKKDLRNIRGLVYSYSNLGETFLSAGNLDSGIYYLSMAHHLADSLHMARMSALTSIDLGNGLFQQQQYRAAEISIKEGLKWVEASHETIYEIEANDLLYEIYLARGNTQQALQYLTKAYELSVSLRESNLNKKIYEIELEYYSQQKQLEFALLNEQNQKQQFELNQRNQQALFAVFVLMGVLGLLLVLMRLNQKIRQQNYLLAAANQQIEQKSEDISFQNERLVILNQELNRANAKQEESIRYLEHFASVAAHDLKAPVRVVASFADLLAQKTTAKLDEDEQEYLKFISVNIRQLGKMVDDLLSLSKIDHDLPPTEKVDPNQVIEGVTDRLATTIEASDALVAVQPPIPRLQGHPSLLGQLLQNLIENSIKYSVANRPPQIQIRCETVSMGFATISVQDNGQGIPQRMLPHIFDLFATTNKGSGSGIGLAISRKIVQHYGGKIWAEAEEGTGTTIYMTLPMA